MAELSVFRKIPVNFSHVWDVGVDNAVFLVGSADEIGGWDPAHAVRLTWTEGNVWTGRVALPLGQTHTYKFIKRSMAAEQYCDSGNVEWMSGDNLSVAVLDGPSASYSGKTVYYYSSWTNVSMLYRCGSTQWVEAAMERIGDGRVGGESLYRLSGIGTNDLQLEFVFFGTPDGDTEPDWDNAPYEGPEAGSFNYFTSLDVFWVQDKSIFNYEPSASLSAPRIEERWVGSTVPEIPARMIRIYLPRGYDEHTTKQYPMFYMHDGQNVYCGDTPAGDKWNVNYHATREIGQGRMRECIIVGMDNGANRTAEYEVPGDRYYDGHPDGIGDKYLQFFTDNVRPTLDYNFRTSTTREDTLIGGSSMGGLISIYFGYATNLFGSIMSMSPSITRAPNYTETLWDEEKRDVLLYLDTGAAEGSVGQGGGDYWYKPWYAYAIFLQQGYAVNDDLLMRIGCGAQHVEAAWSDRYTEAVRFLLDVRREPNLLLQKEHPPTIRAAMAGAGHPVLNCSSMKGFSYQLLHSTNLLSGSWQTNAVSAFEADLWGEVSFDAGLPQGFFRVRAVTE